MGPVMDRRAQRVSQGVLWRRCQLASCCCGQSGRRHPQPERRVDHATLHALHDLRLHGSSPRPWSSLQRCLRGNLGSRSPTGLTAWSASGLPAGRAARTFRRRRAQRQIANWLRLLGSKATTIALVPPSKRPISSRFNGPTVPCFRRRSWSGRWPSGLKTQGALNIECDVSLAVAVEVGGDGADERRRSRPLSFAHLASRRLRTTIGSMDSRDVGAGHSSNSPNSMFRRATGTSCVRPGARRPYQIRHCPCVIEDVGLPVAVESPKRSSRSAPATW